MCWIDLEERRLYSEGRELEPFSVEENLVGFCSFCGGELSSLACYQLSESWMVASRCLQCGSMVLARYDGSWLWKGDTDLEAERPEEGGAKRSSISEISREELEAVFTPAELRDMERFERGEAYTRQNLYRARAKYEKFERLFGVKIDL